jgi:hypothetical protein
MVPSLFRLARLNMRALVMNILIMKFYLLSCRFLPFFDQIFSLLSCCQQNPRAVFSIKARDHVQARREYNVKLV